MSTNVNTRLAEATDAEAIAAVLRAAFGVYRENYTPEAFEAVTPNAEKILTRFAEGPQWVAEIDGNVVGTASLKTDPEGLYLRSMAVMPSVQGKGVGHVLLQAVNEYADASGHERIFLHTTYFVPGAGEMYAKNGFRWVRDTAPEEWLGVPGLEMERKIEKQHATGS
jgi:N-acetylglutamate synthase-like GNAT family acetyltransferase